MPACSFTRSRRAERSSRSPSRLASTSPMIDVLVVDDEPLARSRLRRLVDKETDLHVIGECETGAEAVAAIREGNPQLVFLDIDMPDMSGFDVLEAVGPSPLPAVIFVTAYDEFAVRAFEVNALDYLIKPFD